MSLYEVLDQIIALLRQRKRLTYRLVKREFALDDETLADLKDELIYAQQLAVEEDERVLVWIDRLPTAPGAARGSHCDALATGSTRVRPQQWPAAETWKK